MKIPEKLKNKRDLFKKEIERKRIKRKIFKEYKEWMENKEIPENVSDISLQLNPLFSEILNKKEFEEYMLELIRRRDIAYNRSLI